MAKCNAGVLDACGVEEFNDACDIVQMIVRVAHYANSRQGIQPLLAPGTEFARV